MEGSGGLGVLREARTAASGRWRSAAADDEEVVGDGALELFRPCELTERTRVAQRSSGACRRGFGMAAAARALVGGDGLRSVAGGRESRGG